MSWSHFRAADIMADSTFHFRERFDGAFPTSISPAIRRRMRKTKAKANSKPYKHHGCKKNSKESREKSG
jgi:hypothetical protein